MNWHLQDAKNRFSELVRRTQTDGPQTVTIRGRPAAVMVSIDEYERIRSVSRKSIVQHLLSGPDWPQDMIEEVNRRSVSASRPPLEL